MILLKMLAASVIGYASSKILYRRLHQEGVPEMFRYAFGVVLVVILGALFVGDSEREDAIKGMLLSAVAVGVGVGANRILGD